MPSVIEFPAADTTLVYLIRHGATPHNMMTPPRLQGSGINESLTDRGREQAGRAADALASRPLAAVYTSPLKRAHETAQIIAGPHGQDALVEPAFQEINVGRWENRTWAEIQAEDADAYALYRQNPYVHGYPGGETGQGLLDRVTAGLEAIVARHAGKEVAVVAHSVVNRLYVGTTLGIPPEQSHWTPTSNCGISTVRYKEGRAKVLTVNATAHLM